MAFSEQPVNETVDRGEEAIFMCTYPLMDVSISWNGPGVEAGIITQSVDMDASNSTLTITNVNRAYAGGYFCTAHIGVGMDINSTVAYLAVNCKSIINYYAELKSIIVYDIFAQI